MSLLPDAKVLLIKNFISNETADYLFDRCSELNWTHYENRYGVKAHRKHWIGGSDYNFSSMNNKSEPIPEFLLQLIDHINYSQSICLNSIYANLYSSNKVALGYHSDDEKQLNHDSPVVSLSLGKPRRIWFRNKKTKDETSILLENSDLFIMADNCQQLYSHAIKPDKDLENGTRISLTFREFIY
jgi:alkylated DNA repair dioxygenase AlkB